MPHPPRAPPARRPGRARRGGGTGIAAPRRSPRPSRGWFPAGAAATVPAARPPGPDARDPPAPAPTPHPAPWPRSVRPAPGIRRRAGRPPGRARGDAASSAGPPPPPQPPPGVPSFKALPPVMELLAPRQRQRDFGLPVGQVEIQRDQRETFLLDGADQAPNLTTMQQQLAAPDRVVAGVPGELVGCHVHTLQPHLTIPYGPVGLFQAHFAIPDRLDLAPRQHQAGLPRLQYVVVMAGLWVPGHDGAGDSRPTFGRHELSAR